MEISHEKCYHITNKEFTDYETTKFQKCGDQCMMLYLDTCCYNRLFDNRRVIRNYLEREMIILILQLAEQKQLSILGSQVLDKEILSTKDIWRRDRVYTIYNKVCTDKIFVNSDTIERAKYLESTIHTTPFDSLHLALAEESADYFITTDLKLERATKRIDSSIKTMNPINFIREEVIEND